MRFNPETYNYPVKQEVDDYTSCNTDTEPNIPASYKSLDTNKDIKDSRMAMANTGNRLRPCARGQDQENAHLSREERRKRRRATAKYRQAHATRERIRVEAFNSAYAQLRNLLPTLPPDKKLSKIEILRLAICYIGYLQHVLQ